MLKYFSKNHIFLTLILIRQIDKNFDWKEHLHKALNTFAISIILFHFFTFSENINVICLMHIATNHIIIWFYIYIKLKNIFSKPYFVVKFSLLENFSLQIQILMIKPVYSFHLSLVAFICTFLIVKFSSLTHLTRNTCTDTSFRLCICTCAHAFYPQF